MKPLYILTEGDKTSGLGHLMRCMAVAEMLKDHFNIEFVVPAQHVKAIEILEQKNLDIHTIDEWEEALILPEENELVLIDTYHFPNALYEQFSDLGVRVVALIDELQKFTAHAFLCPAGGISPSVEADPPVLFFSGPAFAPLRKEFLENARMPSYTGKKGIVVCFGGADPENHLLKTAEKLSLEMPEEKITLVTGAAYSGQKALRHFLQSHPNFEHQNNLTAAGMAELFRTHALAITSASTVAYEACASRIPLQVIKTASNQERLYEFIQKSGLDDPDKETCLKMQERLFDGRAGERIKDLFTSLSDDFFLRKAHGLDEEMLLEWANEEEVRSNSFHSAEITAAGHHEWLESKIKDVNSKIWVAEDIREPFALVRIEPNKEPKVSGNVVISINIKKEFRGKGWGVKVLRRACLHYFAKHPEHIISALIKKGNEASVNAFTGAGFSFVKEFNYKNTDTIQMNRKL